MPSASIHIAASPEQVWALVSDVTRVGEWSFEAISAEWLDGATGPAVGVRFKGRNKRRGAWNSTSKVTVADPGREFAFVVGKDETSWRYVISPGEAGSDVVESFEILKVPGAVARALTKAGTGVTWGEREADLVMGMEKTLERLKAALEG